MATTKFNMLMALSTIVPSETKKFHGAGSYKSYNGDAYIDKFFNHQFHGEGILKYF